MKGMLGYKQFEEKKMIQIDTFYHDRYIDALNDSIFNLPIIFLKIKLLLTGILKIILFSKNNRQKSDSLKLLLVLFKKVLQVTPRKLTNWAISVCPFFSSTYKQQKIVSSFVSDENIQNLINSRKCK